MVDTRGEHDRGCWPARRRAGSGPQVLALRRPRRDLAGDARTAAIRFPEGTDATRRAGLAAGARAPSDGVVYAGTEPGAVFRSDDRGETFALERALWDHPHRPEWDAGFGGQAFHTILPHPDRPASVTAAISTGGVYQTADGGASWEPRNQGIRAEFLPEGAAVPRVRPVRAQGRPATRLGPSGSTCRTTAASTAPTTRAASWTSIADGLPADFGFPIVVHPHEPDTVFVFPINGGDGRYPPEGQGPGLALPRRRRAPGRRWARGCPTRFFVGGDARRDVRRRPRRAPGSTSAAATARSGPRADEGETWREVVARPARRDGGAGRRSGRDPGCCGHGDPAAGSSAVTESRAWVQPSTRRPARTTAIAADPARVARAASTTSTRWTELVAVGGPRPGRCSATYTGPDRAASARTTRWKGNRKAGAGLDGDHRRPRRRPRSDDPSWPFLRADAQHPAASSSRLTDQRRLDAPCRRMIRPARGAA